MHAEESGSGTAGVGERWGIFGAIVFALASLVLIATLPLAPAALPGARP
jgi:hypothetical protein